MFLEHPINIKIISEGSCDTEDWKLTEMNYILKYNKK